MKRYLIIISVLAVLIPGVLLAQDELTLEGLAEQLSALAERVSKLESDHATTKVDGYCKLPVDLDALDTEAESKWEELTGEETLTSYRRGVEFNAEQQIVSYYYEERYDRDRYGLFVYYDGDCNPTVGDWELLDD